MSNKTSDKNVANDIKILNRFCEYEDAVVLTDNALEEVQDAIQNILAEREQDKERVKELEKELEKANRQLDLDYVDENYIPKQVVIDKIEENSNIVKEIEKKIKEEENSGDICRDSGDICREYIRDLKRQKGLVKRDILTLQELLEGEK